jgi:hypothetical protein
MGTKLLTLLGFASLIVMVIGLLIVQHQSAHTSETSAAHHVFCNVWAGTLCLVAGWLFSSAYSNYNQVEWPKWPFVKAFEM